MKVADGLEAHYAFCPKCEGRVWVVPSRDDAEPSPAEQPAESPVAPPSPNPTPPPSPSGDVPQALDPQPSTLDPSPPPKEPAAPPQVSLPSPPPQTLPSTERLGGKQPTSAPPVAVVSQYAQTAPRRVAKFITADVAQSRLELENDGELPQLKLTQFGGKKQKKAVQQSGSQWRVALLVCGSLVVSASLLMIGPGDSSRARSRPADDARAIIEQRYIGTGQEDLETYQLYLREALVAHSHGDIPTEKRYYRKVVHLLSDEALDGPQSDGKGLTGLRQQSSDRRLPSDTELHRLLSTLLN